MTSTERTGAVSSPHDDLTRLAGRVHALVLVAGVAVLAGVAILAAALDEPHSTLTREPQYTLDGPLYVGVLNNLGALVWMVGVVLSLVGWSMSTDRMAQWMFLAAAAVGGALLADDFFLVHDWFATESYKAEQALIFTYFLAVVALLVVFGRTMGPVAVAGIVGTLALLVTSASLDVFVRGVDQLWEDGLKFLGICTWSTTWTLRAAPWRARRDAAATLPPTGRGAAR